MSGIKAICSSWPVANSVDGINVDVKAGVEAGGDEQALIASRMHTAAREKPEKCLNCILLPTATTT
jgi:hypothetical protein